MRLEQVLKNIPTGHRTLGVYCNEEIKKIGDLSDFKFGSPGNIFKDYNLVELTS